MSRRRICAIRQRCREDESTRLRLKYAPYYHVIDRQEGARVWVRGREMLMLASNDYLGLYDHPLVVVAGQKALAEWGSGTCGSRFANGSRRFHAELEEDLAAFLGQEACQVTAAGYLSCMSAVDAFARRGDVVLVDRNVHSSLWAGIGLSGARIERFSHNNPASLRDVLAGEDSAAAKLILCEGVYSMEGHIGRLPEIAAAARESGGFLVVDDAHGFGVLGQGGRGTVSHTGTEKEVDVVCGSFSKALSSTGGFAAGAREVIEHLRTHSKQTIFSAAVSPCQAACAQAALGVMQNEPEHLSRLWENTRYYQKILRDLSLDTWGSETPAIPVVAGGRERAYKMWKSLWNDGIFTVPAIAPAVPPGRDLIRTAVSARHTRENLDRAAEAIARAARASR